MPLLLSLVPDFVKKGLLYFGIMCVILVTGVALGYSQGKARVELAWEQDKAAQHREQDSLVLEAAQQAARVEEVHRQEQERIRDELAKARGESEVAVAAVRASYEQRLLQSSRRSAVYQRQAEAGASAARSLAGHAAELDRALEEGVELVGELGRTLGLRERQLTLLGEQIKIDRKICESQP